jgi:hypothetical protein
MVLPQPSRIAMWGCPEWPIRKWIPGVCNTNLYQYTNNRDIVGLSAKLFNRNSKNATASGKGRQHPSVRRDEDGIVKGRCSQPFNCAEKSLLIQIIPVLTSRPCAQLSEDGRTRPIREPRRLGSLRGAQDGVTKTLKNLEALETRIVETSTSCTRRSSWRRLCPASHTFLTT